MSFEEQMAAAIATAPTPAMAQRYREMWWREGGTGEPRLSDATPGAIPAGE